MSWIPADFHGYKMQGEGEEAWEDRGRDERGEEEDEDDNMHGYLEPLKTLPIKALHVWNQPA